jgi:hypothetical protein
MSDRLTGYLCGAASGVYQYLHGFNLLQMHFATDYFLKLGEAGLTAFVSGFLGISARHFFLWLRDKIKGKKHGKNKI